MRPLFLLAAIALASCVSEPSSGPFNAGVSETRLDPGLGVGRRAPELEASLLSGRGPTTLAAASGRVVIVDFFASWCLPCKRSFPSYQRLVERYGDRIAVIAVAVDTAAEIEHGSVRAFVGGTGATFPVLWDRTGRTAAAYRPARMPSAYVIGRDGTIRSVHIGYEDGEDGRIEQVVRMMLGG